jgi:hypothetical protein
MWSWMQGNWDEMTLMYQHWGDVAWMRANLPDYAWMRDHWDDMTWMHDHWSGMTWMHGQMMSSSSGGMMGSLGVEMRITRALVTGAIASALLLSVSSPAWAHGARKKFPPRRPSRKRS